MVFSQAIPWGTLPASVPYGLLMGADYHMTIYVVRHGHVADHNGDVALQPQGRLAAFEAGRQLADHAAAASIVTILYSPSARTRETAEELAHGLAAALEQNKTRVQVLPPEPEPAIRNLQFIVQGRETLPTDRMHTSLPPSAEHDPFFQGFWQAQDPIDYWLTHSSESAEPPSAVAARLRAFFISLLQADSPGVRVLVTHSGPMRAFLRSALGADPGEPDFCEMFQIDASGVSYRGQRTALP